MDHRKHNSTDPWDEQVYGTGNTMPPKSHSGIIALLVILVIFLSGIVSFLSFLNIKLFQQLSQQTVKEQFQVPMAFSDLEPEILPTQPQEADDRLNISPDISISLNKSPQSVDNIPQEGALSWQEVYERNLPSVVSILCTDDTGTTTGSGVVISEKGYVVTNCHLISGAETITLRFSDESSHSAVVVGADALTDLAVLYVDARNLVPAQFGDSGALRVGDPVAAIGDPLGAEVGNALTTGMISAINLDVAFQGRTIGLIQTSAVLNPGNSGGPLINCYGQVVGIHTGRIGSELSSEELEGLNFAIPSTTVKQIVDQLIARGYVSGRPTLGITGESITEFDRYYFHVPSGLYILEVDPYSDAHDQGIEPGDILLSAGGVAVTSQAELDAVIYSHEIGDTITAILYRNGQEQTITLTVTEYVG